MIKFRAWNEYENKMQYGDEIESRSDIHTGLSYGELYIALTHNGDWFDLKPMQFTGLKDSNGNEIYEGDIVRYKQRNLQKAFGMNDNGDDYEELQKVIKYREQSFNVPAGFIKDLEVIGNIYEK